MFLQALDRAEARLSRFFAWASTTRLRAACIVLALAAAIALPGLSSMPVTDRDEARFVQASKQMMETGDYIDIRNLDGPRWKKPAGIYWLQSAFAKIFASGAESGIAAYRMPSALAIMAAALLAWWAVLPLGPPRAALWAGIITGATAASAVEAHIAKTDAALLAASSLAFAALIRIHLARRSRFRAEHALFWGALGAGMLIKGPIILIPAAGAVLSLALSERSGAILRALCPLPGLILFALIAAPWYIAIGIQTEGAFFAESLGKDLLGKVGESAEKHGGPPGYYLASVWLTYWPWAPLTLLTAPAVWRMRRRPEIILMLGWILPFWIIFEFVSTKLPHYILPLLPAFAGLIALALKDAAPGKPLRALALLLFVLGTLGASVFAYAPLPLLEGRAPLALILSATALLVLGAAAGTALARSQIHAFAGFAAAALGVLFPTLTMITAPRAGSLFLSPRLAELHARFETCADRPVLSHGYAEMSLAFLTETDTRFVDLETAASALSAKDGTRVFLRRDPDQDLLGALERAAGTPLSVLAEIEGLNYNSGREITITYLAAKDDPALARCQK